MTNDSPLNLVSPSAVGIANDYAIPEEARAYLPEGASPRAFLDALTAAGRYQDAVRFWAHALPKREAVWWACLCLAEAPGPSPKPAVAAVLAAVQEWAREPDDARRRDCFRAGSAVGLDQPEALVATAVFFTGGSIAPPDLPKVAPAGHVAGDLLGAALTLAAVIVQPERAPRTLERFLVLGIEVAQGRKLWTT